MAKDLRREQVAKMMIEHPEMSAEQIMLDCGYSVSYAKASTQLTHSKSFLEVFNKLVPDEMLTKVHLEGLKSTVKKPHLVDRDDKGRPVYEYKKEEDYSTRHRYLETAYKVKGYFAPEKHQHSGNINITQLLDELQDD